MRKSLHFKKQLMKWIVFCGTLLFAAFYFFPVFYMFITGFKTENQAAYPTLIFTPTLETYKEVLNSDMMRYLGNSVFQVVLGTLITTVLSVFAAFSILFARFKKKRAGRQYVLLVHYHDFVASGGGAASSFHHLQ